MFGQVGTVRDYGDSNEIVRKVESICSSRRGESDDLSKIYVHRIMLLKDALLHSLNHRSSFSLFPPELNEEIYKLFQFLAVPVLVFGNRIGKVYGPDLSDFGPHKNILIPRLTGSFHWNSGRTDCGTVWLELENPAILYKIQMSIRCAKTFHISGGLYEEEMTTLIPTTESKLPDLDTTGAERILELFFPETANRVKYLQIFCVEGGNVSLHWVLIYGYQYCDVFSK